MKTTDVLLMAGVGLGVYYFQQLNVAGQTVQFVFSGVQILSVTKLQVQILVQNVSNASVTLKAITADVTINGNELGSASDFNETVIGPTSQQQINLILDLSVLSLPGTILSLINQAGNSFNFSVVGNANINSLVLPFSLNKSITI